MKRFNRLLAHYPIPAYFITTYAISWVGALLVVLPTLLHHKPITQVNGLLMFPVMLLGPSVAGISLTTIVYGKQGLGKLFSRIGRWRINANWYTLLCIPPVFIVSILLLLRLFISPVFTPHFNPLGIVYGLVPGLLEEIGWMGYVYPLLRKKYTALTASGLLGLFWGLWHLPVIDFLGAAYPHKSYWLPFAAAFIFMLIALRIIIVWIYTHTKSLLLCQLLHAINTGSLVVFSPILVTAAQETLWYFVYALFLWLVVVIVVKNAGENFIAIRKR